ncbi:MAG: hypothetical protein M0Q91_16485 [Methanoregula sp.]|jgi:hypothetical protein|nr:hypothetical protein [Methanoregula sp.]
MSEDNSEKTYLKELPGKVEFSQSGNDLSWTWWCTDYNCVHNNVTDCDVSCQRQYWSGYNDMFWWRNVSITAQFLIKTCKCGKLFLLDIQKNVVYEIVTPSEDPLIIYPSEIEDLCRYDSYTFREERTRLISTISNRRNVSDIIKKE